MTAIDNDADDFEEDEPKATINKRKILLILLPLLIVIGVSAGLYHTFDNTMTKVSDLSYSVVEKHETVDGQSQKKTLVFYDLPEVTARVKDNDNKYSNINIKMSIELADVNNIAMIESLLPQINDIILNHTRELTNDEINGANGLYWLKEELLYRINLITNPIKVDNLNFKAFEVQQDN